MDLKATGILLLVLLNCAGCGDTPKNSAEAENANIVKGLVDPHPLSFKDPVLAQPGHVFQPRVVHAEALCEGSAGSLLPPLSISGCAGAVLAKPIDALEGVFDALHIPSSRRHIMLNGIEEFWVQQSNGDNCWAAVLETARAYHHLQNVPQDKIRELVTGYCPNIMGRNKRPDVYQIQVAMALLAERYGDVKSSVVMCGNPDCILKSLQSGSPVIMLENKHAVLIVGEDYIPGNPSTPKNFKILDPQNNRKLEDRSLLDVCRADAFMSY
jgi:hypothetical protein